jgi:hypothetical protein
MKLEKILNEIKQTQQYPPYMYSPLGFGCHVCKFHYIEDGKHMCSNKQYQKLKNTSELIDNNGNPIKDPSKWCSNFFLPKEK